jgi:hypothetical protein
MFRFEISLHAFRRNSRSEMVRMAEFFIAEVLPPAEKQQMQAAFSTALLVQYDERLYAFRSRLRFVLKRRLHQDSIECKTSVTGSLSTEW